MDISSFGPFVWFCLLLDLSSFGPSVFCTKCLLYQTSFVPNALWTKRLLYQLSLYQMSLYQMSLDQLSWNRCNLTRPIDLCLGCCHTVSPRELVYPSCPLSPDLYEPITVSNPDGPQPWPPGTTLLPGSPGKARQTARCLTAPGSFNK